MKQTYTVTNPDTGQTADIVYVHQLCNGSWSEITQEHAMALLADGVNIMNALAGMTVEQAHDRLVLKGSVDYGKDWYATVGIRRVEKETKEPVVKSPSTEKSDPRIIRLDCGHVVFSPMHVMHKSTSESCCPTCHSRLEE